MTTPMDRFPGSDADTDPTQVERHPRGAALERAAAEVESVQIEVASVTEKNFEKKDRNEDSTLVDDRHRTYGVLDGVGGHAGGEVASSKSTEFIREGMQRMPDLARQDAAGAAEHVRKVLVQTSLKLAHMADIDSKLRGMGSTCSLVHLIESPDGGTPRQAVIAQVGDSRVYRLRNGKLERLTVDQSAVQMMIDQGNLPTDADQVGDPEVDARLTADQRYRVLQFGNVIHMALGPIMVQEIGKRHGLFEGVDFERRSEIEQRLSEIVGRIRTEPEFARWMAEVMEQAVVTRVVDVEPGDEFIALSDGAHDNLLDREMEELARGCHGDPTCTAQEITRAARAREREKAATKRAGQPIEGILSRGKDDDISVVGVRVNAPTEVIAAPAPEQPLIPQETIDGWRQLDDDGLEKAIGAYHRILRAREEGRPVNTQEISRAHGMREAYLVATTGGERAEILAQDSAYKRAALEAIDGVYVERYVPAETLAEWEGSPTANLERTASGYGEIIETIDARQSLPQQLVSRVHGMREAYGRVQSDAERAAILGRDRAYKEIAIRAIDRILAKRAGGAFADDYDQLDPPAKAQRLLNMYENRLQLLEDGYKAREQKAGAVTRFHWPEGASDAQIQACLAAEREHVRRRIRQAKRSLQVSGRKPGRTAGTNPPQARA